MKFTDTIAAVATGNTLSAIGIVRVSGDKAIAAASSLFCASSGISLKDARDRQMHYGELRDASGELIDMCLCMAARAPNTYTGEDTVEFHCHGSPVVLSELLRSLFALGIRQAQAGEFTKRAFLSGRMDLTGAEAVIDLIEAQTPFGAKNAANQLQGAICVKMDVIYDRLVDIMAHFHAVIDYPDEDIDEFKMQDYLAALRESAHELRRTKDTYERGKMLRSGIATAIVGRTNTGKSSLLNALLGFERAIVTETPGTTRDTIEEKVLIGDVLLRLIDTAGLRKTDDTVEKLGLERSLAAIDTAGLVLVVLDGSEPLQDDDIKVFEAMHHETPAIVVINKSDLPQKIEEKELLRPHLIHLSVLTGEGLDKLSAEIQKLFPDLETSKAGEIITSARQAEAIDKAAECLNSATEALTDKVSPDAVLTDIEGALAAIGEVTGKTMREDIVTRIFERFCVGK